MTYLFDRLTEYQNSDVYPFHMPGHKRVQNERFACYGIDVTEIPGTDNLHHAEGILKEAMERAAALYGSDKTYYLVNGSTCGILAAISAVCKGSAEQGIILARNSHKSAYHGVLLNRLKAYYVYPAYQAEYHINGGIDPEDVRKLLDTEEEICAVMITSPTYDGVTSDIGRIVEIAHEYGVPVIVDEAHGAHFPLDDAGCESALDAGADIVIHSLHKTLPSMTQTALLHLNSELVDRERVEHFLQIYQTSSPSYVMMASMDECVRYLETERDSFFGNLHALRERIGCELTKLKHLRLVTGDIVGKDHITGLDDGKVVISCANTNLSGAEFADILLKEYHLQTEMAGLDYVVAILTGMDSEEGVNRLIRAVCAIDEGLATQTASAGGVSGEELSARTASAAITIYEADSRPKRTVNVTDAAGCVSGEFVYAYPPGIPFVVPGEIISEKIIKTIMEYKNRGLSIEGLYDHSCETIRVCE